MIRLLPLAVFVAIAAFLWKGLSLDPGELPSALLDRPAPTFSVATLDGRSGGAARERPADANASGARAGDGTAAGGTPDAGSGATIDQGDGATPVVSSGAASFDSRSMLGRVWLLNVWASWCGPCAQEHPQFVALASRRDVPIIGLNYKDDPDDARAWLQRHGDIFDEVLSDTDGRVGIDWGVYGVPETFVIDADGRVRYKHVGPILAEDLERSILPVLDELAAPS